MDKLTEQDAGPYASAALDYRAAGWQGVLPISKPSDKSKKGTPPTGYTGGSERWPSDAQIQRWIAGQGALNIGLRLPRDVIGIDVDDRDGGVATIAAWEEVRGGALPPTYSCTARGPDSTTRTYFYRVPGNTRKFKSPGAGVDIIQRHHRFALVWPSIHPKLGTEYVWYDPDGNPLPAGAVPGPEDLTELPPELRESLAEDAGETARAATPTEVQDFRAAHTSATRPDSYGLHFDDYELEIAIRPNWRHNGMVRLLRKLAEESQAGLYPADEAFTDAEIVWDEVKPDAPKTEFPGMLSWALGQVVNKPEADHAKQVAKEVARLKVQQDARRELAGEGWTPPDDIADYAAELETPPSAVQYAIDRLLGEKHNAVLSGQYKTGKTTLGMNVVKAALDRRPFLNRDVTTNGGNLLYLNCEMDDDDFRDYIEPIRIKKLDHLFVLHLRGRKLPLLNDASAEWLRDFCRRQDIEMIIGDSWRRMCTWSGVSENRNEEVDRLTDRIDQIKRESGVLATLWLAHTGRVETAIGDEHARGATSLDDWVDARWSLTRGKGEDRETRYFAAEGRRVGFAETDLVFDDETQILTVGTGVNRRQAGARTDEDLTTQMVAICGLHGPLDSDKLWDALRQEGVLKDRSRAFQLFKKARESGALDFHKEGKKYIYEAPGRMKINKQTE
jgi:hypothetical protein